MAERGRLDVKPGTSDGAAPEVSNGLEWGLDLLVVRDETGQLLAARGIPAGATARLHPAGPEDFEAFEALLESNRLAPPPGVSASGFPGSQPWMPDGRHSSEPRCDISAKRKPPLP